MLLGDYRVLTSRFSSFQPEICLNLSFNVSQQTLGVWHLLTAVFVYAKC